MAYRGHRHRGHRHRGRRHGVGVSIHLRLSNKMTAIVLFIVSLFPIGIGTFLAVRHVQQENYYKETTAVISTIDTWTESWEDYDGFYTRVEHAVYVDYEIDGRKYQDVELDYYQAGMTEGQKITIKYDPNNHFNITVKGGTTVGIWIAFGIAGICLLIAVVKLVEYIKEKKNLPTEDSGEISE